MAVKSMRGWTPENKFWLASQTTEARKKGSAKTRLINAWKRSHPGQNYRDHLDEVYGDELPFCKCGCGGRVKFLGNSVIHGHNKPWLGRKRGKTPDDVKEKQRLAHTGKKHNVSEAGHLQILENIKKSHTPEAIEKMRKALSGRKLSRDHIKKSRRSGRPTKIEKLMIGIISDFNLPYRYTGDGAVKFGRLNPDFIHTAGKKIALEVYAKIYKEIDGRCINTWKQKRKERFAEFGWEIYFFDETQITKEFVSETLGGDSH